MNYSYKRFWEPSTGYAVGASVTVGAIATALWQPLDMVKTRIQQRSEGIGIRQIGHYGGYNPNKIFREIHAQGNGLKGLYAGFDSAILARSVHLLVRNLFYKVVYDRVKPKKASNDLTPREKALLGGVAGALGAIVSNPFEVVLIRQQCDGAYASELRRNYGNFFEGYNRIVASEAGALGLFRGVWPSVFKAVALNSSMNGPFNWVNEAMFNCFGDTYVNRPLALVFGAIAGTFAALPFDNVKTRLQLQWSDPNRNRIGYDGFVDCVKKTFLHESWTGFYSGFYVFFVRAYLYGITTILLMDWITTRSKKKAGLKPKFI